MNEEEQKRPEEALPPPPYATAFAYPKKDDTQPPPNYQYQAIGPPVVVYIDDNAENQCLYCGGPLLSDVSYCALFCVLLTVVLTFPFGLLLLCCLPCLFTRRCARCGLTS